MLTYFAANVGTYAEEARKALEEQLRAAPEDPQRHIILGLALACLGRKEEAMSEGERGVALDPVSKDARLGPYFQHQLVQIYMLIGEPEKALDQLEPLLKIPYYLSPVRGLAAGIGAAPRRSVGRLYFPIPPAPSSEDLVDARAAARGKGHISPSAT